MMASIMQQPMGLTVVTAPGKVLATGGYLVLDQKYSGLVLSTDSRFFTVIRTCRPPKNRPLSDQPKRIVVMATQFEDGFWEFELARNKETGLYSLIAKTDFQRENRFVELALRYSLSIAEAYSSTFAANMEEGLQITILGHNDFYSQRAELARRKYPLTSEHLRRLPPFAETHTSLANVNKTGLGSSAAMITSLVAAVLSHLGAVFLKPTGQQGQEQSDSDPFATPPLPGSMMGEKALRLIHNTAQFVHCLAQGKVGSGFDVSAAVWGSQVYRRFSPKLLEPIMAAHDNGTLNIATLLASLDPHQAGLLWDNQLVPFSLPPKVHLMLADIHGGSNTPLLVNRVLQWRKENPAEADSLWTELDTLNRKVVESWTKLVKFAALESSAYEETVDKLGKTQADEWSALSSASAENDIMPIFCTINITYLKIRTLLRRMSELADTPIEPPSQIALLDAVAAVPGTVMCGVPGAGGFDAIFVLTVGQRQDVENVWKDWKGVDGETANGAAGQNGNGGSIVCPLLAAEGVGGVRREQEEGRNGIHSVFF